MKPLSVQERQDIIIELLQQQGTMSVVDIAQELNISPVTIRKDLSAMEVKKLLFRSHGRAILMDPYISDMSINEKATLFPDRKRVIGYMASKYVNEGDAITIGSGSTLHSLAKNISSVKKITVLTSSIYVAGILAPSEFIDVILLGGAVRNTSLSTVGKFAEEMINNFSCCTLFLGVDGIDLSFGLSTSNIMEAELNRVMIDSAQKTIVLADSSKFGRRGLGRICDLEQVDQIITDGAISSRVRGDIEDRGIIVTIA